MWIYCQRYVTHINTNMSCFIEREGVSIVFLLQKTSYLLSETLYNFALALQVLRFCANYFLTPMFFDICQFLYTSHFVHSRFTVKNCTNIWQNSRHIIFVPRVGARQEANAAETPPAFYQLSIGFSCSQLNFCIFQSSDLDLLLTNSKR